MKSFAESYLTRLLERRLLLEPEHLYEVNRGLTMALNDSSKDVAPLEKLAGAVERMDMEAGTAVVNLLNMPLGPLWVRVALQETKAKLKGQKKASVVVVGLWQILKGGGHRTEAVEGRFAEWRGFVEEQLMGIESEELTVLWIG